MRHTWWNGRGVTAPLVAALWANKAADRLTGG
jgi:hypothetical protein